MYDRDGFLVLEVLPQPVTDALREVVSQYRYSNTGHFHYSLMANDLQGNRNLRSAIRDILSDFYASYFRDYRTVHESLLIKPAHTQEEMSLHQDWSIVDESAYQCATLWIPMSDVSEQNGSLFVLPGSHRWFDTIRSSSLPTARIESTGTLLAMCRSFDLRAGQAFLFHPAVLHGSYANRHSEDRIVVTANIIADDADLIHYQKVSDSEVAVRQIDEDAMLAGLKDMAHGKLNDLKESHRMQYTHRVPTYEEVMGRSAQLQ
ncbi:unnamed protein product [Sphagnum balticum]